MYARDGPHKRPAPIDRTGWVTGVPLPGGFFLRTEDDRVIFVETDQPVTAGETVRVAGPLVATQTAVFEGWETDAFEAGFEAEWDVETIVYIDAFTVTSIGEASGSQGGAAADTATGSGEADEAGSSATGSGAEGG